MQWHSVATSSRIQTWYTGSASTSRLMSMTVTPSTPSTHEATQTIPRPTLYWSLNPKSTRRIEMSKSANIMLVHGAWADGSCWSKVILLLQAKGYNVTAAQIPLKSLADDIEVTRRLLSAHTGPTVLVGHSYGGAVITGAATATLQVKAL